MFWHESRPPCFIFHDFFNPLHYFLFYCHGYASCQHVYTKHLISWRLWWCTVAVGVDTITSVSNKCRTQHVYDSEFWKEQDLLLLCQSTALLPNYTHFQSKCYWCQEVTHFEWQLTHEWCCACMNSLWFWLLIEGVLWPISSKKVFTGCFFCSLSCSTACTKCRCQNKSGKYVTFFTNAWKQ